MKKILFVSALVFAAACGNKIDNALNDMEGFKDKMCECKDSACVDSVKKEMDAWEEKMRDEDVKKDEASDSQKERAKEIMKQLRECRRAARKGDKSE